MHRFMPLYLQRLGASIAEVPVHHHERMHGRSRYGFARNIAVIVDFLCIALKLDDRRPPLTYSIR